MTVEHYPYGGRKHGIRSGKTAEEESTMDPGPPSPPAPGPKKKKTNRLLKVHSKFLKLGSFVTSVNKLDWLP